MPHKNLVRKMKECYYIKNKDVWSINNSMNKEADEKISNDKTDKGLISIIKQK